ncbi:hypothetical protein ACWD7Y_08555 [Streptomyces drozdowiczii]
MPIVNGMATLPRWPSPVPPLRIVTTVGEPSLSQDDGSTSIPRPPATSPSSPSGSGEADPWKNRASQSRCSFTSAGTGPNSRVTDSSKVSGSSESSSSTSEPTATVQVPCGRAAEGAADSVERRAEPDFRSASSPRKDGPLFCSQAPQQ